MAKQLERYKEIERSIITTYRKTIWSPFVLAVKKYQLIDAGDKIAVRRAGFAYRRYGGGSRFFIAICVGQFVVFTNSHKDLGTDCRLPFACRNRVFPCADIKYLRLSAQDARAEFFIRHFPYGWALDYGDIRLFRIS